MKFFTGVFFGHEGNWLLFCGEVVNAISELCVVTLVRPSAIAEPKLTPGQFKKVALGILIGSIAMRTNWCGGHRGGRHARMRKVSDGLIGSSSAGLD
jgi:hypothetical protein